MNIIKKWAARFGSGLDGEAYARGLFSLHQNQVLAPAVLAIHGAASPLAKNTAAVVVLVNGQAVKLAAADLPALTGVNLIDGQKCVVGFVINIAGTVSVTQGNPATTYGGMTWPARAENSVTIGYVVIETTGAVFTGGTTNLDAGTVTATYINSAPGGVEPLTIF